MSLEPHDPLKAQDTAASGHDPEIQPNDTHVSRDSQTATEYINKQLQLEADAREVLPYSFNTCTYTLGPLKQSVFACLTCNPPPASAAQVFNPAGVCYSCSISCHGDHTLVELFNRRNFTCDCGTTRFISAPCTLRAEGSSGAKGVSGQSASKTNTYNQNFQNRFCGCGEEYDAHQERGTMFQCLGLGTVDSGGCGEDWWHPECVMGLSRDWYKTEATEVKKAVSEELRPSDAVDEATNEAPVPPGFPEEEDFDTFICYKCVESNPWIKNYAGTTGFLPAVFKKDLQTKPTATEVSEQPILDVGNDSRKRKASEDIEDDREASSSKKPKEDTDQTLSEQPISTSDHAVPRHKHDTLPVAPSGQFSIFLKEDFREQFCHCPSCYPHLLPHPQLLEEEETYEPPLSESGSGDAGPGSGARSQGTGSLLDRGEAALSTMDRVKAIEGVMVYNHLKDKVKEFLKPYAESGQAVSAEDIKAYFEKLRGDESGIKEAGGKPQTDEDGETGGDGVNRKEQSGY